MAVRLSLSSHFTYRRLLRFTLPTMVMMVFMSLYSIVDGVFVSNFVGKTALAAVNLIFPVSMALCTIGFMVGTGGSAVVARTLGEGKEGLAQEYFSLLIFLTLAVGGVLSVLGVAFTPQIALALGAEGQLLEDTVRYGRILFAGQTAFMLQSAFQCFFVAAERPGLSLRINIAAGLTNMVLDGVFIAGFQWGLAGAAAATVLGEMVGSVIPLVYFARRNGSLLRLRRPGRFYGGIVGQACLNGSSEMVSNLSASLVNILYNFQLMALVGEDGVAAYGVIMYVNFVFVGTFLGFALGSAPLVSYHYGAGNREELHNLFAMSLRLMAGAGIVLTLAAEGASALLVGAFAGYDPELYQLTLRGFRLYSLAFLCMGMNLWGSAFFTALNNGAVSAAIAFLRALVFQVAAVLLLPLALDLDGVWLAVAAAEVPALGVTACFLAAKRKKYGY